MTLCGAKLLNSDYGDGFIPSVTDGGVRGERVLPLCHFH